MPSPDLCSCCLHIQCRSNRNSKRKLLMFTAISLFSGKSKWSQTFKIVLLMKVRITEERPYSFQILYSSTPVLCFLPQSWWHSLTCLCFLINSGTHWIYKSLEFILRIKQSFSLFFFFPRVTFLKLYQLSLFKKRHQKVIH